jgi:predicted MPP superfamily phosphohydrolase
MPVVYVHLSDIHFGQEKGGDVVVNDDVKQQILLDVREYIGNLDKKSADGVIISGDIAYGGKASEYEAAGKWLDRLTAAIGCDITDVQVVPGNHDIDRDKITNVTQKIIDDIIEKGDDALDCYLEREEDREILYARFSGYRTFAEGYNCPLDTDGKVAGHRTIDVAPGKKIKFHGVNTSLICSKSKKEEGGLLLGKRQRVISVEPDTEIIVIAHHPLNWLQDSEDAKKYIRNRARVFISGHEHMPSHKIENVKDGVDLLSIASGATMPPSANDTYNYCYNILEFDYDNEKKSLIVTIHGRMWNDDEKAFNTDKVHFTDGKVSYALKCPNYEKLAVSCADKSTVKDTVHKEPVENEYINLSTVASDFMSDDKEYQLVLLKFFRDLSTAQRLTILVELHAIPEDWSDFLSHTLERRALDKLVQSGHLTELHKKINQTLNPLGDKK